MNREGSTHSRVVGGGPSLCRAGTEGRHLAVLLEIFQKLNLLRIHLHVEAKRTPNNQNEIKLNEKTTSAEQLQWQAAGAALEEGGVCNVFKTKLLFSFSEKRDPDYVHRGPASLDPPAEGEGPASLRCPQGELRPYFLPPRGRNSLELGTSQFPTPLPCRVPSPLGTDASDTWAGQAAWCLCPTPQTSSGRAGGPGHGHPGDRPADSNRLGSLLTALNNSRR